MLNTRFSNAGQYWVKVRLVCQRKQVCSWQGMFDGAGQCPLQVVIFCVLYISLHQVGFVKSHGLSGGWGPLQPQSMLSWHAAQWRSTASGCMGTDQLSSSFESGLSWPAPPWHHWWTPTPTGLMHCAHWGQHHSFRWTVWCLQDSWHQFLHKSARRFLPRSRAGR